MPYEEWTRYLRDFDPMVATRLPPDDLYQSSGHGTEVHGWEGLDTAAHARFTRDGFVIVRAAFSSQELLHAEAGVADLFQGKHESYVPQAWGRRHGVLLRPGATLDDIRSQPWQDVVVLARAMVQHDERLSALATHPGLVAAMTRQMGGRPELLHNMLRAKPGTQGDKPWHQDLTHFNVDPRATSLTAWIAFDDIPEASGCLYFLPGSHRHGPVRHVFDRDYQLPDSDVPRDGQVAAPVRRGDCVLFNALTVHGSPQNHTGTRRVALQLTFASADAARITDEVRIMQFAGRSMPR